jgi:hypothetical protein
VCFGHPRTCAARVSNIDHRRSRFTFRSRWAIALKMAAEKPEITIGARFKLSELGASRSPRLAVKIGTIIGVGRHNSSITVMFDGNKSPTSLHRDYIEPISKKPPPSER